MVIEKKVCISWRSGDIETVPNLLKNRQKLFIRPNRSCLKMTCDQATWVWCLFKFIWYNQNPILLFQCIAICSAPFESSTTMPLQFCYFFLPPATHSFSALGSVLSCPSSRVRKSKNFPDSKIFGAKTFRIKRVNRVNFQILLPIMSLLQKLSGFAKTFQSALLTRWQHFCDSA